MWFEQSIEMRLLSNVTRSADGCALSLAQAAEVEAAGDALVFKRHEASSSALEASREERTCSMA
jgi:hypothetical protein